MMMWFNPLIEEPGIRSFSSPVGDEDVEFYEGGALGGTSEGEEGVPRKGGEARETEEELSDLPF